MKIRLHCLHCFKSHLEQTETLRHSYKLTLFLIQQNLSETHTYKHDAVRRQNNLRRLHLLDIFYLTDLRLEFLYLWSRDSYSFRPWLAHEAWQSGRALNRQGTEASTHRPTGLSHRNSGHVQQLLKCYAFLGETGY